MTQNTNFPLTRIDYPKEPAGYFLSLNVESDILFDKYGAIFEKHGWSGNGYEWSGVFEKFLTQAHPGLLAQLSFDPEAGGVAIMGKDKESLEQFEKVILALVQDESKLETLISEGDPID